MCRTFVVPFVAALLSTGTVASAVEAPSQPPRRSYKVLLLATPKFRSLNEHWKRVIESALRRANGVFEEIANVRFEGLIREWEPSTSEPELPEGAVHVYSSGREKIAKLEEAALREFPDEVLDREDVDFVAVFTAVPSLRMERKEADRQWTAVRKEPAKLPRVSRAQPAVGATQGYSMPGSESAPYQPGVSYFPTSALFPPSGEPAEDRDFGKLGEARWFSRRLFVRLDYENSRKEFKGTLIHELGHIFGAVHVPDKTSVMYADSSGDNRHFDPANAAIVRLTAGTMDFQRGMDAALEDDAFMAEYTRLVRVAESKFNPVTSALSVRVSAVKWDSSSRTDLSTVEKALQLEPEKAELHVMRAFLLENMGRSAEALEAYKRSIEFNPESAFVRYKVSRSLSDRGEWVEAASEMEEAVRIEPNDFYFTELARVQLKLDRKEDAIANLRKALELRPGEPSAAYLLEEALR